MKQQPTICVVGLGYVGLPLAHAFARAGMHTIGYDIDAKRIEELQGSRDRTRELSEKQLDEIRDRITYSVDPKSIDQADVVILAIPTPVDAQNKPDLTLLMEATRTVGRHAKDGAIIVYESTVYPGVTEEICGSTLRKESGGKRFRLCYSPERMNPGDKEHTIEKIVKIVAGEDAETTELLAQLYGRIVTAGVHRAPSIKVAEMAKAIENAQRDINIAYTNEIAIMCHKLGIATSDVLAAARTKWNFLPFTPGLVGGHCIGVDPYYLIEKAMSLNMNTDLITAARKINDGMAHYVAQQVHEGLRKVMKPTGRTEGSVLVLGLTFKENIPDTRNAKAGEVVRHLRGFGHTVSTHDPYVEDGDLGTTPKHDAILLLVPHREYLRMTPHDLAEIANRPCLFYDLKSAFPRLQMEAVGFTYLAL